MLFPCSLNVVSFTFRSRLLFSVEFLGGFLSPDLIYHYWSLDLLNSQRCFVLNQDLALAQTPLPVFRHWSRHAPQDMLDSPSLLPGVMHSDLGAHAFLLAGLSYCSNSTSRTSQDYGYTVFIYWLSPQMESGYRTQLLRTSTAVLTSRSASL